MPEINLIDAGVVGLAVYGIIVVSIKVVDVLKDKFTTSPGKPNESQDELSVLLANNNLAITELTHFLRTQSAVDTEKGRLVEKQLDLIVAKVDKLSGQIAQHCIDTNH